MINWTDPDITWRKSSRSGGGTDMCVEVAFVGDQIGIRDSKNPGSPILTFNQGEWDAFVGGVKDGEFDL